MATEMGSQSPQNNSSVASQDLEATVFGDASCTTGSARCLRSLLAAASAACAAAGGFFHCAPRDGHSLGLPQKHQMQGGGGRREKNAIAQGRKACVGWSMRDSLTSDQMDPQTFSAGTWTHTNRKECPITFSGSVCESIG